MLKKEKAYGFRDRISVMHRKDIRNFLKEIKETETAIADETVIYVPESCGEVIYTAAKDFADYLFVSMNISTAIKETAPENKAGNIVICCGENTADFGEAAGKRGYRIDVNEGIEIFGFDERGAAQALYRLEDIMNTKRVPYIDRGTEKNKPLFTPQMVHSGVGMDSYPDEYLSAVAHQGRDAILIFVKEVDKTPYGYLDFNDLIRRAAKYGIDVYAYGYFNHEVYPEGEAAEAYYEASYGKLFEQCPGIKGISLVGESLQFESRDERVEPLGTSTDHGLPSGGHPMWAYPCRDYPVMLNMLGKVIRRHKPDADIIFWTYNWGSRPAEERLELIDLLPTDITLMATFEMCQTYKLHDITETCADYTISKVGPGDYFSSEAKRAKERGIRLYSMTNTGGMTWDFGTIPYEPVPYQWMKRYDRMRKANADWGLCGIMESHHYGFWPSFIGRLSKEAFMINADMEKSMADTLAAEFGEENVKAADEALKCWSEAITHYVPCNDDQYGPFRCGPSYPMCLDRVINVYSDPKAHFGNCIIVPGYFDGNSGRNTFYKIWCTVPNIRIKREEEEITLMKEYFDKGIAVLEGIENTETEFLLNMGKYISHCVQTTINMKKWAQLKMKLKAADTREEILRLADEMTALAYEEIENVRETIPLVEADSRLGWEPSMEYICDREHLEWKIRQVEFVINTELKRWKDTAVI